MKKILISHCAPEICHTQFIRVSVSLVKNRPSKYWEEVGNKCIEIRVPTTNPSCDVKTFDKDLHSFSQAVGAGVVDKCFTIGTLQWGIRLLLYAVVLKRAEGHYS